MFYEIEIEDVIRIPPEMLKYETKKAVFETLRMIYPGMIKKDAGLIVGIKEVKEIGEGMIVPEDGGVYYKVKFSAISFKPELNEIVLGIVNTITEFGAFVNIGPLDALVHISQIMDDEVSISSKDALVGKKTRQVLKVRDIVRARIISISYRDPTTVKVALTMRQPGLGKLDWIYKKKEE